MRAARLAGLSLAAAALAGSCAHVEIDSSRRSDDLETIEPALFVVYRNDTPATLPRQIKDALESQAQRRKILAKTVVISGTELNELETIIHAAEGMKGVVTVSPVSSTVDRDGNMLAVLLDVRAFRVVRKPAPDGRMTVSLMTSERGELPEAAGAERFLTIWRARVDMKGSQIGGVTLGVGVEAMAEDLMRRLVAEHVLAGFGGVLAPPPTDESPVGG
jgi:hypothetical protein